MTSALFRVLLHECMSLMSFSKVAFELLGISEVQIYRKRQNEMGDIL